MSAAGEIRVAADDPEAAQAGEHGAPVKARVLVILNSASGSVSARSAEEIAELFAGHQLRTQVAPCRSGEVSEVIRRAVEGGTAAVIAAGGDGTIGCVAAAVAGTSVPMGVLPMGTLNHFAKDLGLPTSLPQAVGAIAAALEADSWRDVDVGEVNGHVFVNNSSIGIYPRVVRRRDKLRERVVLGKWIAMLYAALAAFRRYPELEVSLELESPAGERHAVDRCTPFVFVGNNRYALHLLAMGERTRLDRGELCVYVAHRPGRFGMLWLAVLALFRRLKQARDFNDYLVPQVTVRTRKRRIAVALDGEVRHMVPPLQYRTRPGALRVLVPPSLVRRSARGA